MTELKTHVENMVTKAAQADKSEDAMRFAQAALNAANAVIGMAVMERDIKK
jgi:hypothetical protein